MKVIDRVMTAINIMRERISFTAKLTNVPLAKTIVTVGIKD